MDSCHRDSLRVAEVIRFPESDQEVGEEPFRTVARLAGGERLIAGLPSATDAENGCKMLEGVIRRTPKDRQVTIPAVR